MSSSSGVHHLLVPRQRSRSGGSGGSRSSSRSESEYTSIWREPLTLCCGRRFNRYFLPAYIIQVFLVVAFLGLFCWSLAVVFRKHGNALRRRLQFLFLGSLSLVVVNYLLDLADRSLRLEEATTTNRYLTVYIISYGFDAIALILLFGVIYMLLNHWLTTAGTTSASYPASGSDTKSKSGWVWFHRVLLILLAILVIIDVGLFAGLQVQTLYSEIGFDHYREARRLADWVRKYGSAVQIIIWALAFEILVCAWYCRAAIRRRAPGVMGTTRFALLVAPALLLRQMGDSIVAICISLLERDTPRYLVLAVTMYDGILTFVMYLVLLMVIKRVGSIST
ncbi:MAG: hypothetical protein M1823_004540 [Watsoniomyces obsoletus]|nr:MAG: hypothetical protein M1823_004540 [Watsoniomyces obsoletus]